LPLIGTPSQPLHVLFVPPHNPHASITLPLLGTPSHPTHATWLPKHTPHESSDVLGQAPDIATDCLNPSDTCV
jgi:hypothetical protein